MEVIMAAKEMKIREHKFFDKHTIIGAVVLFLAGLILTQGIGATIFSMVFGIIFSGDLRMSSVGAEIGAIFASFPLLCLFWRHFYPEYEGGLRGGVKLSVWIPVGIGISVLFSCIGFLVNALTVKSPVGIPGIVNIFAAIMAGVYEEAIFRGMVASYLMRQWRDVKEKKLITVVMFSSVIFGAVHMMNALQGQDVFFTVIQSINAFAMGCMFCAFFLRSGSLIPGMLMHGLYDFLQFMFISQMNEGGTANASVHLAATDILSLVIIDVVCIAITLFLIRPAVREDISAIWDKKWKKRLFRHKCGQKMLLNVDVMELDNIIDFV